MVIAKYQISITLNFDWWTRLQALQTAGVKIVDVVRAGIETCETRLAKEMKKSS